MKRVPQTLYKFEDGETAATVSEGRIFVSVGYSSLNAERARELGGILSAAACEAEAQLEAKESEIEAAQ